MESVVYFMEHGGKGGIKLVKCCKC